MVRGIRVDIVTVSRFARMIERHGDRLLDRLFTGEERSYFAAWADPVPRVAGRFAAKDTISRQSLLDNGMTQTEVDAVPIGEAFLKLVETTGQSAEALTAQLYAANNVGKVWFLMASVGLISAAGMYVYGRWTYKLKD